MKLFRILVFGFMIIQGIVSVKDPGHWPFYWLILIMGMEIIYTLQDILDEIKKKNNEKTSDRI